ncbi:MAG: radical SAM protein [Deltaproteobacteria bacterium]|nr:radical SAM protein [Deltaproteobacteria bacterium]
MMVIDERHNNFRDMFYKTFGRDNMCLLWHVKEVLKGLPVRHILDVGAGMRVSQNICLPKGVKTALIVDPDRRMLGTFVEEYHDDRIETLEGNIGTADFGDRSFDLVFLIMSLLWIDDPPAALLKVASQSPAYIVISNPEFLPEELSAGSACFPGWKSEFMKTLGAYAARALDFDATMESCGYYPLAIFHSPSWRPTPEHAIRTVLYTREKPDRTPYDQAKYIIQINSKCNFNCPACYVLKTGDDMDPAVFRELIEPVQKDEMICLRGGEPTLTENLIEDFIQPALQKGIHVVLESNGTFIGLPHYQEYLAVLTHKPIEVRLSLDRQHLDPFPERMRRTRIGWISQFIGDAKRLGIPFGLFALGMCREQVKLFLREYSVESWLPYIQPITRYSDITDLSINGMFVDVDGSMHDYITGIGWVGEPDKDSLGL